MQIAETVEAQSVMDGLSRIGLRSRAVCVRTLQRRLLMLAPFGALSYLT